MKPGTRPLLLGYDERTRRGEEVVAMPRILAGAVALALAFVAAGASAHHSIQVHYDRGLTVEFVGVLSSYYFVNPHVWYFFDEVQADGTTREWAIEAGPPSEVRRAITRQFGSLEMEPGKKYTVQVAPNRTEPLSGFLKSMLLPSGAWFKYPGTADP